MKERPILMSAPMVRALLDGSKTQTRRAVKKNASGRASKGGRNWHLGDPDVVLACPYGQTGDRLWVRETWLHQKGGPVYDAAGGVMDSFDDEIIYRADRPNMRGVKWRPSIFMPRWASRILLEITDVRVERLQNISEDDAIAEGCFALGDCECTAVRQYSELWESINGAGSWAANPWVWVVAFEVCHDRP